MVRAPDLAHAAFPNQGGDFIRNEPNPRTAELKGVETDSKNSTATVPREQLPSINGRTLSRVTRRAGVRKRSGVKRRATFDRAVWTKPLAFAADAALSAMSFQSYGPRAWERARQPRRSMSDGGDTSGA